WHAAAWTEYFLEGVKSPKSRPSICIVRDAFQRCYVRTDNMGSRRQKIFTQVPTYSTDIANDVVTEASGNQPAGPGYPDAPAIWVSECAMMSDHSVIKGLDNTL